MQTPPTSSDQHLHECALRLLTRRAHGYQELQRKLRSRGFHALQVEEKCRHLAKAGLLDDTAFCDSYIKARAQKGFGPARIEQELAAKGVANAIISAAISDSDINWDSLCQQVAIKKYGSQSNLDAKTAAKRARFLYYRGFRTPVTLDSSPQAPW